MTGRLFLVPNLLGVAPPENVLPARTIAVARGLGHFIVENAKPARAFLKSLEPARPLREIAMTELGPRPTPERCAEALAPARGGVDVGLVSDAGCPGIADPGAGVVAAAHRGGPPRRPPRRPFRGAPRADGVGNERTELRVPRLPAGRRAAARRRRSARSKRNRSARGGAQLFIETPYRNPALLAALVDACRPQTRVCVAADLTLETETIEARTIRAWRGRDFTGYAKRPAMFVLQG